MVGHLPFDAYAVNLYEEHLTDDDTPWSYKTKAFGYVQTLLADPDVNLIVLTGDAGHGKTHLCRKILEKNGRSPQEALDLLKAYPAGEKPITLSEGLRPVRIVKDVSEGPEQDRASILSRMLQESSSVGLVCANEGRLRSLVASADGALDSVQESLEKGLRDGTTSSDGRVHVVNLNFQAVAPHGGGFLGHLLAHWIQDGRKWRSCQDCDARSKCPILRNRLVLERSDEAAENRIAGLLQLVRTVEQSGYVLTIREALILVAYLITGGLTCKAVAERHSDGRRIGTLPDFHLESLLFERELSDTEAQHLGILERIRRCDPGRTPHRDIDEDLLRDIDEELDTVGDPVSASQRKIHARELVARTRAARRRSFLTTPAPGAEGVLDRARRMGLFHYSSYEHIQSDDEDPRKMKAVIERVVLGLHVIQGIRPRDRSSLYLVDPAFSRSGSHTSVVAMKIPSKALWLWGLHEHWQGPDSEKVPELVRAVDWVDRKVVLCSEGGGHTTDLLTLDLLQFEFVMRAADGVVFSEFHAADRRRILASLAKVAEVGSRQEREIRFVWGDAIRKIEVERDGSIQVHGDT